MCGSDPGCKCGKRGASFKANLSGSIIRNETLDGVKYWVIPVVLARADVEMNDSVMPIEEMLPDTWNGVPVTVNHPSDDSGAFLSANTPKTIDKYCIGRIFNAKIKDAALVAEAWLDVSLVNKKFPDLVPMIKQGKSIDVSTGYFADVDPTPGEVGGRKYSAVHRHVRPDHLALLPNDAGACSWEDGCGVRSNKGKTMSKNIKSALAIIAQALKVNADPAAEKTVKEAVDNSADIADLIAAADSPFQPTDEAALKAMSPEALAGLMATYCPPAEENVAEETAVEPPKKEEPMPAKNVTAAMSDEDKAALAFARNQFTSHKAGLVSKVVANSKITKEAAEAMSVEMLQMLADNLVATSPSFAGRALPQVNKDDKVAEGMKAPSLGDAIRNKRKAG